jgi:hypothetical protein
LLYTDGLVERRDEVIDEGLARLARCAHVLNRESLDDGLRKLVARLHDHAGDDDAGDDDAGDDDAGDDDVTAIAVRVEMTAQSAD